MTYDERNYCVIDTCDVVSHCSYEWTLNTYATAIAHSTQTRIYSIIVINCRHTLDINAKCDISCHSCHFFTISICFYVHIGDACWIRGNKRSKEKTKNIEMNQHQGIEGFPTKFTIHFCSFSFSLSFKRINCKILEIISIEQYNESERTKLRIK